jgi:hypothetical protein
MWRLANQGEAWRMNLYTNFREGLLSSITSSISRAFRARSIHRRITLSIICETPAIRRSLLRHHFCVSLGLAQSALDALVHLVRILSDHRRVRNVAFVTAVGWDEDIKPARDHEAAQEEKKDDVAYAEAHDVQGILSAGQGRAGVDEVGVGEGVDDC